MHTRTGLATQTVTSKIKFSIKTGNLIDQDTQVIVNPENCFFLCHEGGAAKAIATVAGPNLLAECENFIRHYGQLAPSCVTHTRAGHLPEPIQYVTHACGPQFKECKNVTQCLELLEPTFLNCLLYANDILEARSIALPAISAGVFGVPIHIVALAISNAAWIFDQYLTTLPQDRKFVECIKIVNTDDKIVEMLAAEIGNKITQTHCQHAQTDDSSLQRSDGLGYSHAHSADASNGTVDTRHAERSADQPADCAVRPWVRRHTTRSEQCKTETHARTQIINENSNSTIKSDI